MDTEARKLVPFTNEHFAAFLENMLGAPYWYGTCMYKCTEALRARKARQYPSHYSEKRTAQYKRDIEEKRSARTASARQRDTHGRTAGRA